MSKKIFLLSLLFIQTAFTQTFEAVLEPKVRKFISTRMDGVLLKSLDKGTRFSKGEVILSQPTALIKAEAEQINFILKSLKKEETYFSRLAERKKEQLKEGIINEEDYESVLYELTKTSSKISSYLVELKKTQLKLQKANVKADFNGLVSQVIKQKGEFSRTGEVCLELIDDHTLLAVFPCNVQAIKKLWTKSASIEVFGQTLPGRIVSSSPEVDAASGLVQVKVELVNKDLTILPGQKCKVLLK